jgi:hypothetical protein
MRYPVLAAFAFATTFIALPASAQTYGAGYPVCLHQYGPATYYDCTYSTIAQCNASALWRTPAWTSRSSSGTEGIAPIEYRAY